MRTTATELSQLIRSSSQQLVGAVRRAAGEDLDTDQLTDLLKAAFSCRNQIDAALTAAIGALDRATEEAPRPISDHARPAHGLAPAGGGRLPGPPASLLRTAAGVGRRTTSRFKRACVHH